MTVCAALEVGLNRYLALEPAVLEQCAQLSGRAIELRTVAPAWSFFIEFHGAGVRVLTEREQPAEVSVAGPLTQLLRLAFKTASGEAGLPTGLTVIGEAELLLRFNRMLAQVGFDPEEWAAKFIGDAAAHRAVQGLQKIFGWSRNTANTLALDTAEYLREETGDLARRADANDWMAQVDRLREAVDRFDARLQQLEATA